MSFRSFAFGCLVLILQSLISPSHADAATALKLSCQDLFQTGFDLDYVELENINGRHALKWVEKQNARTVARLQNDPRFANIKTSFVEAYRNPGDAYSFKLHGNRLFSFHTDEAHPKGLWEATSIKSYFGDRTNWRTILDIGALSKKENEDWFYIDAKVFRQRALVLLSRGGKDAVVVRELDLTTGKFVKDGFSLPEGRNFVSWMDQDTIVFNPGDAAAPRTESGYPSSARLWRRGMRLDETELLFSVDAKSVNLVTYNSDDSHMVDADKPAPYIVAADSTTMHETEYSVFWESEFVRLPIPTSASLDIARDFAYIDLKTDWRYANRIYRAKSFLRIPIQQLIRGEGEPEVIFKSTRSSILQDHAIVDGRIFISLSRNVSLNWFEIKKNREGKWRAVSLGLPAKSNVDYFENSKDRIFFKAEDFLHPETLYQYELKNRKARAIATSKPWFNASSHSVRQYFAVSSDGTKIPYYVVAPKKPSGPTPTILTAYGGFADSMRPSYSVELGQAWIEQMGTFVVANIRGGGEYGPEWHEAALKEKRQTSFDDLYAVAEDLIARGITEPRKLGIYGRSNGGLLMGVAFTQRPDLFAAAHIEVPLLDMLRYHKLLAGPSWIAEYGDPKDPKMREALLRYSPFHNVFPDRHYPEVLITTSTNDDRVHPGHARRMVARLNEQGHPVLYYERLDGGHLGFGDVEQFASDTAMSYVYFLQKLKDEPDAEEHQQ